jgi:hypothetical protein
VALAAFRALTPAQDLPQLERQLKRLREGGDAPAVERLKTDVDDLTKQVSVAPS